MSDTAEPDTKKPRVTPSAAFATSPESVAEGYMPVELTVIYVDKQRPADLPATVDGDGIEAMRKRLEIFIWDRVGPAPTGTYLPCSEILDAFRQSEGCEKATRLNLRWTVWNLMREIHPWCKCEKLGFHRVCLLPPSTVPLGCDLAVATDELGLPTNA